MSAAREPSRSMVSTFASSRTRSQAVKKPDKIAHRQLTGKKIASSRSAPAARASPIQVFAA